MVAVLLGFATNTGADTELRLGEELSPFVVLNTGTEGVTINKATS